jgi:hypothetical protein
MPRKRNLGPNASEKVRQTTGAKRPAKGKHDVTQKDVDRLQKQDMTLEQAAEELEVAPSTIATAYYQAEINNDPSVEIKGSERQKAKGIVAQRKQGVRWRRLAVRSGLSEARVKEVWEEETGIPYNETWTGRGAPPAGMTADDARELVSGGGSAPKKRGAAKRGAAKRSTAKRSSAKSEPAKRSGTKREPAKARTRAERLAKSGKHNPS